MTSSVGIALNYFQVFKNISIQFWLILITGYQVKSLRDPTCRRNMHIMNNSKWRTNISKYFKSQARYEKAIKSLYCFKSSFK